MKKQTSIYTVQVEQVIRDTYRVKAQTKDEALQIAAKLWGRDKEYFHSNNNWDITISKIVKENDNPSESDLEYVDNKQNDD